MDVAPSRGPQRVGKGYIAMPSGGGIHAIKISASLTQDLVGLTELAVLSLQGLELGGHVRGQARLAPAVSLGPANPLMQRLRRAADLRGNRSHRRPPRGMILLVLENQPNRARAHFRRKSVRCLACHRSTFSRLGASGKPGAGHCEPTCKTSSTPTTSPGGSKPSGAKPHTNLSAKPGLQSHTDSKSARSSKCRD